MTGVVAQHWTADALCASPYVDPEWWFTASSYVRAAEVCAACPVQAPCLELALDLGVEAQGMWAGRVFHAGGGEGRLVAQARYNALRRARYRHRRAGE